MPQIPHALARAVPAAALALGLALLAGCGMQMPAFGGVGGMGGGMGGTSMGNGTPSVASSPTMAPDVSAISAEPISTSTL